MLEFIKKKKNRHYSVCCTCKRNIFKHNHLKQTTPSLQQNPILMHTDETTSVYHKYPNQWIGRGSAQNWPPWSPDLNPLDYHVWGYMKAMVYEHKVTTSEELFQQILSAARSINNTTLICKITSSLVTRVRKFIQADGGHFEQLA